MPGSNWSEKIEKNLIWILFLIAVGAFEFGWQISGYITSKSIEGAIEQKDGRIDSLKDDLKKCQEALANCEKKTEKATQEKTQLPDKLKGVQSSKTIGPNTQILTDTNLCPNQGLPILDGKAVLNYWSYSDDSNPYASITILSEVLEIQNNSILFFGPGQQIFTADKKEYIVNCSGFDTTTGRKGCIRISVCKK